MGAVLSILGAVALRIVAIYGTLCLLSEIVEKFEDGRSDFIGLRQKAELLKDANNNNAAQAELEEDEQLRKPVKNVITQVGELLGSIEQTLALSEDHFVTRMVCASCISAKLNEVHGLVTLCSRMIHVIRNIPEQQQRGQNSSTVSCAHEEEFGRSSEFSKNSDAGGSSSNNSPEPESGTVTITITSRTEGIDSPLNRME